MARWSGRTKSPQMAQALPDVADVEVEEGVEVVGPLPFLRRRFFWTGSGSGSGSERGWGLMGAGKERNLEHAIIHDFVNMV